jgi:hypothetical protein
MGTSVSPGVRVCPFFSSRRFACKDCMNTVFFFFFGQPQNRETVDGRMKDASLREDVGRWGWAKPADEAWLHPLSLLWATNAKHHVFPDSMSRTRHRLINSRAVRIKQAIRCDFSSTSSVSLSRQAAIYANRPPPSFITGGSHAPNSHPPPPPPGAMHSPARYVVFHPPRGVLHFDTASHGTQRRS